MNMIKNMVLGTTMFCTVSGAVASTVYDEEMCVGAEFTEIPTLDPFTDLPYLVNRVNELKANPADLFYDFDGPVFDFDPWTNWYKEPDFRDQLAKLATMRGIVDKYTYWNNSLSPAPEVECPEGSDKVRQIDGTCNDKDTPAMGAAGMRFGRSVMPLQPVAQFDSANFMNPNPRTVSRKLFTRGAEGTKKGAFLNMLAVTWIQFQVHDWVNHVNKADEYWEVPLEQDDPLAPWLGGNFMKVAKTLPDSTRQSYESPLAPTFQNEVTHWWDGSQVYGSDMKTANRLRAWRKGHLKMDRKGLLPRGEGGFGDTGFRRNWWVGLSLMHNLFAKEHNWIADELAKAYPHKRHDDQWLYDKARMINAANMAKIHTIEWTPAVIGHPGLNAGMNANWFGLNKYMNPPIQKEWGVVPPEFESVIFGVLGGKKDLKTYPTSEELQVIGVPKENADQTAAVFNGEIPYALTEEFASIYRMHPLLPDYLDVYKLNNKKHPKKYGKGKWHRKHNRKYKKIHLKHTRDRNARKLIHRYGLDNLIYTFAKNNPGVLELNNYPAFLQNLFIPFHGSIDLGAVDILRDRERGVPRYNELRRQIALRPLAGFDELTGDPELNAKLREVYNDDIEQVDLLVGTLAEGTRPTCYLFGETLFQIFTGLATRRLQADRFYTDDFTPEVYTERGMEIISETTLKKVLLRHFPQFEDAGLGDVENAFFPW